LSIEEREIEGLLDHFLNGTTNEMVRKQIIDTLSTYGNRAIEPINRAISNPTIQNE
jgi:hypothetical protein